MADFTNGLSEGFTLIDKWMYNQAFFRNLGMEGGTEESSDGKLIDEVFHPDRLVHYGKKNV